MSAVVIMLLVSLTPGALSSIRSELPSFLVWLVLVAVTDLLPVPVGGDITLALSLPLLLAAAMLFPPAAAGLLALIGSTDPREFRGEIGLRVAVFNRSQVALSVLAASSLFHALGGDLHAWPLVLLIAFAAIIADFAVNFLMVVLSWLAGGKGSVREAVDAIVNGRPVSFLLPYVTFGLAAVVVALAYETAGSWGLLVFVIPVLLARYVFLRDTQLRDITAVVFEKNRALVSVSESIADERRDERLAVAAGLHDELLPPLYKVHLMGQVLRQDLATGRLLNLEDDLPELLGATEEASEATQALIRSLRHSAVGTGGLVRTLELLVREMQTRSSCRVELESSDVGGSPVVQLLAYQVAREALRNAIRHSQAKVITVSLSREASDMRLVIEDDGRGFDPSLVDAEKHFGLQLMKERVELAGGLLYLDSRIDEGTTVLVRLPAETSAEAD